MEVSQWFTAYKMLKCGQLLRYCLWKTSYTTCYLWNTVKHGIFSEYSPYQLVQDFFHHQYHPVVNTHTCSSVGSRKYQHTAHAETRSVCNLSRVDQLVTVCFIMCFGIANPRATGSFHLNKSFQSTTYNCSTSGLSSSPDMYLDR